MSEVERMLKMMSTLLCFVLKCQSNLSPIGSEPVENVHTEVSLRMQKLSMENANQSLNRNSFPIDMNILANL